MESSIHDEGMITTSIHHEVMDTITTRHRSMATTATRHENITLTSMAMSFGAGKSWIWVSASNMVGTRPASLRYEVG
jgi:hypothetical protein